MWKKFLTETGCFGDEIVTDHSALLSACTAVSPPSCLHSDRALHLTGLDTIICQKDGDRREPARRDHPKGLAWALKG